MKIYIVTEGLINNRFDSAHKTLESAIRRRNEIVRKDMKEWRPYKVRYKKKTIWELYRSERKYSRIEEVEIE